MSKKVLIIGGAGGSGRGLQDRFRRRWNSNEGIRVRMVRDLTAAASAACTLPGF
jgi:hypothetical protein